MSEVKFPIKHQVGSKKRGSYFESNTYQLNSILEELDKVNNELNNYVSNLNKENTKIDAKIQEFNNTIDTLDPEKDAELIASITKKILDLNRKNINNQEKIARFNKSNSNGELIIFAYKILGITYRRVAQPAQRAVIDLPQPVPIRKKKSTIPSPSSAKQQAELKKTIYKFNDRHQTQKTLLNDYLTKNIFTQPAQA